MLLTAMVGAALAGPLVHVDRRGRRVYVLDEQGEVTHSEPAGIGRGGLGRKSSMGDLKTPTGRFVVDLLLAPAAGTFAVSPAVSSQDDVLQGFVNGPAALARLWSNMDQLDFDGDGAPDHAYGSAYIGLHSPDGSAVTGPKLRRFRGTPYWYSIALHGTPDPTSLGQARSGGCVHLSAALLQRLVTQGTLALGAEVVIADGPPP